MTLEHSRPAPATHQPNTAPAQTPTVQRRLAAGSGSYAVQARALAPRENVQMHGGGEDTADVHAAAASGIASGGGAMPFASQIQQSFGGHDIGHVQAHTGSAAVQASAAMGAEAYATGDHVAFGKSPDLHTAAHEAAHVVQQSAGVSLSGGVGQVGDAYENHADRVADAVVQGKSAEPLLNEMTGGQVQQKSAGGEHTQRRVQRVAAVQREYVKPENTDDGGHGGWVEGYEKIDAAQENFDPNATLTSTQYKMFAARIAGLLAGIKSPVDPEGIAQGIWLKMMAGLQATQAKYNVAPEVGGDGPDKKYKKMSDDAFQELLPEFQGLISEILGAFAGAGIQDAKSWGFWSGEGAKDAAKTNCEASLEGGYIGKAFDSINIGGGWDIQLWGALSQAYAQQAVASLEGREFHIFVGTGKAYGEGITTENIWAQVESKEVYAAASRDPDFTATVHAVVHPKNATARANGDLCWNSGAVGASEIEGKRVEARAKADETHPEKPGPAPADPSSGAPSGT